MMNELLTTEEDNQKLFTGSDNSRKADLMIQLLPGFEVNNPGTPRNLLNRSLATFTLLLSDLQTRAEILNRSAGHDFVQNQMVYRGVISEGKAT
jgi:hypothetical protein